MKQNKVAGLALILGALGLLATMAVHPTGGSMEKIARQARLNTAVHALAIGWAAVLTFGFVRLSRAIGSDRPSADAGLVAFIFAIAAGTLAPILNGSVIQGVADRALAADAAAQPAWHALASYNHLLSAALAQVLIAGASAAMLLWSMGLLRIGRSWTYLGVAGVAIGLLSLLALFAGRMRHNIHDFLLWVLGLTGWTTALGILLCRRPVNHDAA